MEFYTEFNKDTMRQDILAIHKEDGKIYQYAFSYETPIELVNSINRTLNDFTMVFKSKDA